MVEPFSEIGMISQVSAIQPVMHQPSRPFCDPSMLPEHLRGPLDRTFQNVPANALLQFVDLFPVPGSALTGHTYAVEHTIGRSRYHRTLGARLLLPHTRDFFRVMPFGLCNAHATFERFMDRVLQGLRWSRCLVYLDDNISFGTTFDDALDNLTLIFERLRSYGLQLKSSKCHLFQTSVPFLGHVVGRWGLECVPRKIEDVKSWPIPDCLKSVRQFLGFVGYYWRFILSFADHAEPLVALTGKDVPFIWRPACAAAFTDLRDALVRAPMLAFPTGDYILDTDASNFGLGGVLSQIQDEVECVIAYCSRALRPSQRKYCTTKREMLAAVSMCIQFRSYLHGIKFTLRTDHKSLVWLHRFKDTEGMMVTYLTIVPVLHRA